MTTKKRNRLIRKAFAEEPLFAMQIIEEVAPDLSLKEIQKILSYKKKKKKGKSQLTQYGRYPLFTRLLAKYHEQHDNDAGLQAIKLRKRMTQPFRIERKFGNETCSWSFPATTGIQTIYDLTKKISEAKTEAEAKQIHKAATRYNTN